VTSRSLARVAARIAAGTAPLAAAGIAAFATFARQEGIAKARTVWAEDGPIFAECAYFDPAPLRCVVRPYQGSLFVVPRLGALLAAAVPPAWLSLALTAVAALVVAICALAVARAIARATGSPSSGLMGGAALALVHQAGIEVGGNLTNLHWILLAAAVVLLVAAWLARHASVLDAAIVVLAALSSAFAPLLLILAAVGAWLGVARGRILLVLTSLATLAQAATSFAFPRTPTSTPRLGLGVSVQGYTTEVVAQGAFGGLAAPPDWIVVVGIGWVLLLLLVARTPGRFPSEELSAPRRPSASPSRGIVAIVALVGAGAVVFGSSLFVNHWLNRRYGYVPSVLAVEALVIATAWLRLAWDEATDAGLARGLAWATLPVVLAVLAIGFVGSFRIRARASNGPDYVAAYEMERGKCATGSSLIEIAIAPRLKTPKWHVRVPCSRVTDDARPVAGTRRSSSGWLGSRVPVDARRSFHAPRARLSHSRPAVGRLTKPISPRRTPAAPRVTYLPSQRDAAQGSIPKMRCSRNETGSGTR
jgi:hypothetical protein